MIVRPVRGHRRGLATGCHPRQRHRTRRAGNLPGRSPRRPPASTRRPRELLTLAIATPHGGTALVRHACVPSPATALASDPAGDPATSLAREAGDAQPRPVARVRRICAQRPEVATPSEPPPTSRRVWRDRRPGCQVDRRLPVSGSLCDARQPGLPRLMGCPKPHGRKPATPPPGPCCPFSPALRLSACRRAGAGERAARTTPVFGGSPRVVPRSVPVPYRTALNGARRRDRPGSTSSGEPP